MSQRFYLPIPQIFTDLGILAPGWKLYFYETGTTTAKAVFSDTGLSIPLPNPVLTNNEGHLVDGSGNITSIYYADASMYKAILKDENDIEQWTADPCDVNTITLATLSPRPAYYAGITTGSSSAYVLDANPPYTQYTSSDVFELSFHIANVANPTLQYVADGAALNLVKKTGQGTTVGLVAGDVQPGGKYWASNNGSAVEILNPRNLNIYTGTSPILTIAGGVASITNSGASYRIATQGGASSDDLDTINGGDNGEVIIIQSADSTQDVVVKHLTGNIYLNNTQSYNLETTNDRLVLQYNSTDSRWIEVARNKQIRLGAYSALLTVDTIYQAAYDGILMATITSNSNGITRSIVSDANASPTTVLVTQSSDSASGTGTGSVTASIKKGNYYKVTCTGTVNSSIIYFQPFLND
jgi:hypothetical protein